MNSAKNYSKTSETQTKLDALLKNTADVYAELYEHLGRYRYSDVNFSKHRTLRKIMLVFSDQEKNAKINEMIDVFLVLAEKQQIFDINKITGIDLETDSGQKAIKDISSDEAGTEPRT
jgi:putative ribosome biogenesis GTPase RsgA